MYHNRYKLQCTIVGINNLPELFLASQLATVIVKGRATYRQSIPKLDGSQMADKNYKNYYLYIICYK